MTALAPKADTPSRPQPSDIDVFGITHAGKVRPQNQDQFLIASLHKTMQVHASSLPAEEVGDLTSEARGYLFMVADGVGGRPGGERASGTALQTIAEYATHTMRFYYHHDPEREGRFLEELRRAVRQSHEAVLARDPGAATTLTMAMVRWPRAYLVHVGDSRCYRLRGGRLELLTKDQTMAQALVDAGVIPSSEVGASRWRHVLSSALGGNEATPMLTATEIRWDDVLLLCTDGLTKHVADTEIEEQLATVKSAEAICRNLLELTLERGAIDNVTLVAGRLRER